jgi:hypothetical protein
VKELLFHVFFTRLDSRTNIQLFTDVIISHVQLREIKIFGLTRS